MENYCSLMWTIRARFDVIDTLRQSSADFFSRAESAAFHSRKIVEALAFACLVAIDNGLNYVPRDAEQQWNAETIFKNLKSQNLKLLPSPSLFRHTYAKEKTSFRHKCDIAFLTNIRHKALGIGHWPAQGIGHTSSRLRTAIVEGIRERRLVHSNLIEIYQRFQAWLNETRRLKPILHLPLVRPSAGAQARAFAESKNKMGIKARFRMMTND